MKHIYITAYYQRSVGQLYICGQESSSFYEIGVP